MVRFNKTKVTFLNSALGLCKESGEVADQLKKCIFQGHDLDKEKNKKELGGVLWYVAGGVNSTQRIDRDKDFIHILKCHTCEKVYVVTTTTLTNIRNKPKYKECFWLNHYVNGIADALNNVIWKDYSQVRI